MKPNVIPVQFSNIPDELKRINRWVLWKLLPVGDQEPYDNWKKMPCTVKGAPASSSNPQTWTDFFSVQEAYNKGGFSGVGFIFNGSDLMGIDIDDCRSEDGTLSDFAKEILENVQGYAEVSPSGTGIKIFTRADIDKAHVDHSIGLEIYNKGRYFTVTGHVLDSTRTIPMDAQDLSKYVTKRSVSITGDESILPPVDEYDLLRVENEVLSQFDSNCGYSDWMQIGMALHHQFNGDIEALELWDKWSYNEGNSPNYTPNLCQRKWDSFGRDKDTVTLRSLLFKIKQKLRVEAINNGQLVIDNTPIAQAQAILDTYYETPDGYGLTAYGGDLFEYKTTHWAEVELAGLESQTWKLLHKAFKQTNKGDLVPVVPNITVVNNAVKAIKAIVHLPKSEDLTPPIWFDKFKASMPDASKMVSVQNGLYYITDSVLLPHSLGFFTVHSLPFNYDANASCPNWLAFLKDVFGEDTQSIECVQEMFGYVLTGDMKQQKFFNIIGPRRSGKGTINRVLTSLLGQYNTISPQLEEITENFGLQPWIHKQLATFTDARLPDRNRSTIVSQLLRIVGGDPVTVNRKNKESWSGNLSARIIVYSNELLQLSEASNALTGRMIVIQMTKSFYGKEDVHLIDRLLPELSGIFNWALEGNVRRLIRQGERFVQPESAMKLLEAIENVNNPVLEFLDLYFEYDAEGRADKHEAFRVWRKYATDIGLPSGSLSAFTRKMLATCQDQNVDVVRSKKSDNTYGYAFRGLTFNMTALKYLNELGFGLDL